MRQPHSAVGVDFGEPFPTAARGAQAGSQRDTRAHGRQVGAVLAELAALREREAQILRDLSVELENRLAVGPELSLMDDMNLGANEAEEEDPLMSVAAVAERLAVVPRTVRRMRERGEMPPAIDLGSVVRWRRSVIEEWISEREEAGR